MRLGLVRPPEPDDIHQERLATLSRVEGTRVLEVGCGPRKTSPTFVALDLTPGGSPGTTGNAAGQISDAEVCGDGALLPFRAAVFEALVARHNLEHYVNLFGTIDEWARVLVPGGQLVAVLPDESSYAGRTVELDPTHYHSFDREFVTELLVRSRWTDVVVDTCIPAWSIIVTARSPSDTP